MKKIEITGWQLSFILVNAILPTAVLTLPSIATKFAKQDAWISILIATGIALLLIQLAITLSLRHPKQNPSQVARLHFGKFAGTLLALSYSLYFMVICYTVLREFTDFMASTVMTETPILVFSIVFVLLGAYAIANGIEVIARVNVLVLFISFLVLATSTVLFLGEMNFENILPLWDVSLSNQILGAMTPLGWLSESAMILYLIPYLKKPETIRRHTMWAVLIVGISLAWTVLGTIMIFGSELVSYLTYPAFNSFRIIRLGRFLERIDIFFVIIWVATVFMKFTIFFFLTVVSLRDTMQLKTEKSIILPLGILVIYFSIASWENTADISRSINFALIPFLLFQNVIVTFVLFLGSYFKKINKQGMNPIEEK